MVWRKVWNVEKYEWPSLNGSGHCQVTPEGELGWCGEKCGQTPVPASPNFPSPACVPSPLLTPAPHCPSLTRHRLPIHSCQVSIQSPKHLRPPLPTSPLCTCTPPPAPLPLAYLSQAFRRMLLLCPLPPSSALPQHMVFPLHCPSLTRHGFPNHSCQVSIQS